MLTRRLLMARSEFVLVARLKRPAESVLSGRPKHKVWGDFARNRVHLEAVCVSVNPLGPMPSMNSIRSEMVHGFLNRRSTLHSVE